jgi:hypothetical protein
MSLHPETPCTGRDEAGAEPYAIGVEYQPDAEQDPEYSDDAE